MNGYQTWNLFARISIVGLQVADAVRENLPSAIAAVGRRTGHKGAAL